MIQIETLLEYSKTHSKSVIIILIGIIIVGATGGWLWISKLKYDIDQLEKISVGRSELVKERHHLSYDVSGSLAFGRLYRWPVSQGLAIHNLNEGENQWQETM